MLLLRVGGVGADDEWDDERTAGLEPAPGAGVDLRYPRMPGEQDPSRAAERRAIAAGLTMHT